MAPLLPVNTPKVHPLGCHRRRIGDREVLNAVFFVLRTGYQWKALGRVLNNVGKLNGVVRLFSR